MSKVIVAEIHVTRRSDGRAPLDLRVRPRAARGTRSSLTSCSTPNRSCSGASPIKGSGRPGPRWAATISGKRMNSIHKYVVSSTLTDDEAVWGSTTVIRQDPLEEIAKLRDRPGGNLLVEGSAQLVHGLARNGLVDEYRLMVFPVVLGGGKRVFPDDLAEPSKLTVADSRTVGSGVLLLTCHPAGS